MDCWTRLEWSKLVDNSLKYSRDQWKKKRKVRISARFILKMTILTSCRRFCQRKCCLKKRNRKSRLNRKSNKMLKKMLWEWHKPLITRERRWTPLPTSFTTLSTLWKWKLSLFERETSFDGLKIIFYKNHFEFFFYFRASIYYLNFWLLFL